MPDGEEYQGKRPLLASQRTPSLVCRASSNFVPRVLSYPPHGARARSMGRVGENPGNEVALLPLG